MFDFTILGLGLLEIFVILVVGLVVLGPERLQAMGRSAGRLLAQVLAWLQRSPEAQLVQEIQKDFEREIIELRDEIVRARKQLDVSAEVRQLQRETSELMKLKEADIEPLPTTRPADARSSDDLLTHLLEQHEHTDAPEQTIGGAVEQAQRATEETAVDDAADPLMAADQPDTPLLITDSNAVPRTSPVNGTTDHTHSSHSASNGNGHTLSSAPTTSMPGLSQAEHAALIFQLQALVADLHALHTQLQARDVLADDWQLPSHDIDHDTIAS
jgi:Sec-independent protein translocase protein TatA